MTFFVAIFMASLSHADTQLLELDLSLSGWEEQAVKGNTEYELIETDGEQALEALCDKTASSLYQEVDIDINDQPYLAWEWRIKNIYDNHKEKEKTGADYPARVFVVIKTGSFGLTRRVINYVWASHEPVNSQWPHPYYANSAVIASVESGAPENFVDWRRVERDIKQDVKQFFDLDSGRIRAIGLMTDCDNTEVMGSASYRRITLSNK